MYGHIEVEVVNPDIKKLWVDALRSGEYPQGRYSLSKNGRYCCLGVLCDLAVKADVVPHPTPDEYGYARYSGQKSGLPDEVIDWAGLRHNSRPDRVMTASGETLSVLNDGWSSFSEIADIIEEQL